jgi:hypothetical protein
MFLIIVVCAVVRMTALKECMCVYMKHVFFKTIFICVTFCLLISGV